MLKQLPEDHPRGCGDKLSTVTAAISPLGSPPRMRGQGETFIQKTSTGRITPADAGTRAESRVPSNGCKDHPRGCGDKSRYPQRCRALRGSPPRMRGQGALGLGGVGLGRITPADAGTSLCVCHVYTSRGDHPRGCGDKGGQGMKKTQSGGSPPRMRGQVVSPASTAAFQGITPADAGTRRTTRPLLLRNWDHPRGCGDKPKRAATVRMQ